MLKQLLQYLILFSLLQLSSQAMNNEKKRSRDEYQTQRYDQRKKQKLDLHQNLLAVIENETIEMVVQLLAQGANPNQKDTKVLTTPLHHAAKKGLPDIINVLLNAGADLDAKNSVGATALHFAAREGNTLSVKLLIEKGADLECKSWGFTPLHQSTNKQITKILLDTGANPMVTDTNNQTPLHHSAYAGRLLQSIMLLSHTKYFLTNLTDTIISEANIDVIKEAYLSYIKSLCSIKNNQNITPLDMATEQQAEFPQRNSYKKLIYLLNAINAARKFNEIPGIVRIDASTAINNYIMLGSENNARPMEID